MSTLNYLNVGCGGKFHPDWVNIDVVAESSDVIEHDINKGLPFGNNTFEVVYHSQVLEHFPKQEGKKFIRECYRVLKPGGILRIVVPDLENIAKEYIGLIEQNTNNPTEQSKANYEWILLEMFDQIARNKPGGEMAEYLSRQNLINKEYVFNRIGYNAIHTRNKALENKDNATPRFIKFKTAIKNSLKLKTWKKIPIRLLPDKFRNYYQTGKFRNSGEVHYFMYDRFSLTELISSVGFRDIKIKSAFDSDIPDWGKYELDVKNNQIYDPASLYVEAKK